MGISAAIFREYDIRGIVGKELSEDAFELLGKAYGTYLLGFGSKKAIVGHDNRQSSASYKNAFIKGLLSTGCAAVDVGMIVTPMLYFARKKWETDGGAMITASHNPPEYNGLKLTQGNGCIFGKELQKIRKIAESKKFAAGKGKSVKKGISNEYAQMIAKKICLKKKLKAVVDCGNGTASPFAAKIFQSLGCQVIELFCESDPSFPNHFPDPTIPEFLAELSKKVVQEKADLGIALDGDSDRIGVVDDTGNILFGDTLLILFSREILSKNRGAKVIVEVKCSQSLIDEVQKLGGKTVLSATGHSIIENRMHKEHALLAGEMSGHIYFGDEYYSFDDAIYAGARLMRLLSQSGKKLSQLLSDVPKYFNTPEIRVDCAEEEKERIVSQTKKFFAKKYPKSVTVDGIRVVFPDGWALVRKSNTQPKLILRFESKTPQGLERIKTEVLQKLREFEELQDLKI